MRDDEIDDPVVPVDDESTELLERLDEGFEDIDVLGEQTPSGPPLSRQEIDDAVDRALAEELARLSGQGPKQ
ncbi:MAG TPA: hypothetical protein VKK31_00145 [Thermoanaerobaculia bacterium]|nr:hypothetical protein [Thermoanaerobaculia bacterium]